MGVTSTMALMARPAPCSERIAASRPEPGPLMKTSTWRMPCSCALRAAFSAARPAAYGVLLREPLNPTAPALLQVITLPSGSVIVTIVLLKLDCTYALPRGTILRSRRRGRAVRRRSATALYSSPDRRQLRVTQATRAPPCRLLLRRCLLATSHGAAGTTARAGVRPGALTAHRQAPAMAQAAVTADLHQAFDVEVH